MITNLINNKKGKDMRKKSIKMMVIAGAVAMLLPTAAMAEWDQSELHANQEDHDALINVNTVTNTIIGDFSYNNQSPIGYDYKGDGTATMSTASPFGVAGQAPWNTTPCPIQLADTAAAYTWDVAMGNCPAQIQAAGWLQGQTNRGWAEGDNELFGPILDDLYQSLSEDASSLSNENGEKAFKKVDQVLDILFYRANTVGEVYGVDGWTDAAGTHWLGALGIDQTLDQDVADLEGTTGNALGTPNGTWLWNYDHVAQTFYQDFQIFDKGNTTGAVGDVDGDGSIEYTGTGTGGDDYVNLSTGSKYARGDSNPRNRHGLEILAVCAGVGCTYDTSQPDPSYAGWGDIWADAEDFGFFDQWVIQSLQDRYAQTYDGNGTEAGVYTFTGNVSLAQSYSSWMAVGVQGDVCNSISVDVLSAPAGCNYTYEKIGHSVNKNIAPNTSAHQTGDP